MKNSGNKDTFHPTESYQPHLQPIDKPKGARIATINKWLKQHRKIVLALVIALILAVGGSVIYLFSHLTPISPTILSAQKKTTPQKYYSPLTGVEVSKADSQLPVIGVMIENSPDARPQSGLKEAGVVFESVTEGGITRFMTLYQEGDPANIGPVRSVRPQFASWVAAFDAGLAHVGGSDIPLAKLRSGQIKDLDQFFNGSSYTRVTDRYAPHNVYTSADRLRALAKSKGYTSSNFTAWPRKKQATPSKQPDATSITMPVSTGLYAVSYTWDQASNSYLRSEGGKPHIDREKGQIAPKVVIALQIPHDVIRDSNHYTYPNVIGSGSGWVFQDGTVTEITWSKDSDKDQLLFKDSSGKEVPLEAGQTWVTDLALDATPTWQ